MNFAYIAAAKKKKRNICAHVFIPYYNINHCYIYNNTAKIKTTKEKLFSIK